MISEQDARWIISETLRSRGFQHHGPDPDRYSGAIRMGHTTIKIYLTVPDLRFVRYPRIEVIDRSSLPVDVIAHIETENGLCYADKSFLRLDVFDPGGSVLRVIEEAEKTLLRSLAGRVASEISAEYVSYWKGPAVRVLIPESMHVEHGLVALGKSGGRVATILLPKGARLPEGYTLGNTALILEVSGSLSPHADFVSPSTVEQLATWHADQNLLKPTLFGEVLRSFSEGEVVFYRGDNGYVGCLPEMPADLAKLRSSQKARPATIAAALQSRSKNIVLTKYHGTRADLTFVTTRNLANLGQSLGGKSIALVGCGAIGSYLARFLIQNGAGNGAPFVVIDDEVLVPGNLGRHLLNFEDIGRAKADALAQELQRFHPQCTITPIAADVMTCWSRIVDFDLIIDATGVEAVSDAMNLLALERRQRGSHCNILHVWLFADGVAARTFLNVGGDFACYRCLRPELDKPWLDDPRKNVAEPGDFRPAACGDGPYVPFSVEAPVTAAALAAGIALDFFSEKSNPRMRSRVIDHDTAKQTSDKSPSRNSRCPACNAS